MITYDEALKKARTLKPDVNICVEYKDGYMFGTETGKTTYGGGNAPVVILKENGKAITMAYFAAHYEGEPIKTTKI